MPNEKYFSHSAPQPFTLWWDADSAPYPGGPGFGDPAHLDLANVDEPLRALVAAINASAGDFGITTVSACAGHPERDEYGVFHVELWLRVTGAGGLKKLHDWIELAVRHRIAAGGYSKERVIRAEFLGARSSGYYFVVYGDFINVVENRRVVEALTAAWQQ